jgi:hypothetical protein
VTSPETQRPGTSISDGPSDEEVPDLIASLVAEVQAELLSDRWVLLFRPTDRIQVRIHAGAGLLHCCELLADLDRAATSNREVALRVLGRAHLEVWITTLYIHYGESDALQRLAADLKYNLEAWHKQVQEYDKRLANEVKRVRAVNRKIRHDNEGKARWNDAHPEEVQRERTEELRLTTRPPIGWDLAPTISSLEGTDPKVLPFSTIIAKLNKLAKEKAIGEENFDVIYIMAYRLLSTVGAHPTLEILNSYIRHQDGENFVRLAIEMNVPSFSSTIRHTALMGTAFLANRVIAEAGGESPVADSILALYYEESEAI